MVAKKDFELKSHSVDLPEIRNLEVIKALQSLQSRGFVKVQFNWQVYYYFLTDDGIQYLREYLHLPAEIVPATFKKLVRAAQPASGEKSQQRGDRPPRDNKDGEYRRRSAGGDKKEGAPGGFKPEFRGGAGRGKQ